jgi:hypothetical protein
MTIKSSGSPLSFTNISAEFPSGLAIGATPDALGEFRRMVLFKPSTNSQFIIPNDPSFGDFYGVSWGFNIDVLIVGGGGGGGGAMSYRTAGGGGGGGYARLISNLSVIPGQNYSLTAGRGGAGGAFNTGQGNGSTGTNSSFTHNGTAYVANGGGGGGGGSTSGAGRVGGNGGGGGAVNANSLGAAGNQGFAGGNGNKTASAEGGGGGGSTLAGLNGVVNGQDGVGGSGFNLSAWMGTANYRTTVTKFDPRVGTLTLYNTLGVGGGGGGGRDNNPLGYVTGQDGGGYGCFQSLQNNSGDQFRDGLNRTGGGGGGGATNNGAGAGGSGVVIVRYQGSYRRDTSSGTGVEYRTGTVGGIPYQFVVFGRSDVYDVTLNEIFTPNPNPVFA